MDFYRINKSPIDLKHRYFLFLNMIQWLTTIKSATEIVHLSRHYVLLAGSHFYVLTSKPIKGLNCHVISETNVEQQPRQQILVENPIAVDSTKMNFRITDNGLIYQNKYKSELQPHIDNLERLYPLKRTINKVIEQED